MGLLKVLIVGSGGREHALAWKTAQSTLVQQVIVAPGNAGTAARLDADAVSARIVNVDIRSDDVASLRDFAILSHIDLTIVGPEVPLANGIVDDFMAAGLRVFGPSKSAAMLEASKSFSKQFMLENGIPTAQYASFTSFDLACAWVHDFGKPVVVKADGLAAGKGVVICGTYEEAVAALRRLLLDHEFGSASESVVIEERLTGREVSVLAFCDGHSFLTMPTARDHKRIFDHDEGPNTGGMGAYAPVPDISIGLLTEIECKVIRPTIDGMLRKGIPYKGVLYAGIMVTPDGPRTLEFNCRFGDPETQAIIPLLESDLVEILTACIDGTLDDIRGRVNWFQGACATVVTSAPGYPGPYAKGTPITGIPEATLMSESFVFHAGTTSINNCAVTSGGRVLAVSARGAHLDSAIRQVYEVLNHIHFEGMHYRTDIGMLY